MPACTCRMAGLHVHDRAQRVLSRVEKRGGDPVSVAARAVSLFVAFFVVIGLGVFVALYYIGGTSALPTVHYAASGGQANVVLQEDPQNDSASKPDWVSYFVQDPANSQ